jgi:hypothetical protein
MTAFSGATPAYVPSPPGRGLQAMPALAFAWDGAATPTLTVTQVAGGALACTVSGQSLARGASVPQSLASAAAGGNSWEVGAA